MIDTASPAVSDTVPASTRSSRGRAVVAVIALTGIVLTALGVWAARSADRNTERRLLEVQTKQAGAVLSEAIAGLAAPMQSAQSTADATGGRPAVVRAFAAEQMGAGKSFVSAALWRVGGASASLIASAGTAPGLPGASLRAYVVRASRSRTFLVRAVYVGGRQRIAYAVGKAGSPFVIYAERAIPANRRVAVESDSAFSELHFATYVGDTTRTSALATTDLPLADLPLHGSRTDRMSIPFGDSSVTLVTEPSGHLGGPLSRALPWDVLIGGLLLTVVAAAVAWQLSRRRTAAEADTRTITTLYQRLEESYNAASAVSLALQHALLPSTNPDLPGVEVASRYVAGAAGLDIGGDWYSVIRVDDARFAFVVGDVSGRGIEAAALMARLRFTLRAYLIEGHPPDVALAQCSRELDVRTEGRMATAMVGVGDLCTREVCIASAGHFNPLHISPAGARYLDVAVGCPLGIPTSAYEVRSFTMQPGSTLIAFTDGLIERRGESIDVGLGRLAAVTARLEGPLDDVVEAMLRAMNSTTAEDDIAVLALRWTDTR